MLKIIETNLEAVPAELQGFYAPTEDGKFKLQVSGVVLEEDVVNLKAKNKELRESNIGLLKTNESLSSLEQVFGMSNISPDAIKNKIDELASQRATGLVTEMKQNYETKLADLETNVNNKTAKLTQLMLGEAVQKAGSKHGVVATAYDDVLRRAQSDFDVTDEGIKFKHNKLDAEGKPYTLDTWMNEQSKLAPHLFASSQGTGATRPVKGNITQSSPGISKLEAGLNKLNNGNSAPRI